MLTLVQTLVAEAEHGSQLLLSPVRLAQEPDCYQLELTWLVVRSAGLACCLEIFFRCASTAEIWK